MEHKHCSAACLPYLSIGPVNLVDHISQQHLVIHRAVEFLILGVLADLQVVSFKGLAHTATEHRIQRGRHSENNSFSISPQVRRYDRYTVYRSLPCIKQHSAAVDLFSGTCSGREPFYPWRSHLPPASLHKLPFSPLWIGSCISCTEQTNTRRVHIKDISILFHACSVYKIFSVFSLFISWRAAHRILPYGLLTGCRSQVFVICRLLWLHTVSLTPDKHPSVIRWLPSIRTESLAGADNIHLIWNDKGNEVRLAVLFVTNPPKMEDSPEVCVDSIQKEVGPGGPAVVYGWHGGHGPLQTQEVFLHLKKKKQESSFNSLNVDNLHYSEFKQKSKRVQRRILFSVCLMCWIKPLV